MFSEKGSGGLFSNFQFKNVRIREIEAFWKAPIMKNHKKIYLKIVLNKKRQKNVKVQKHIQNYTCTFQKSGVSDRIPSGSSN